MRNRFNRYWSNKWFLSIGSGILLGLSFPPIPLPFLIFPAWILLFRLAELASTGREAIYWSYFSFLVWNLITTYWLMMASVAAGIAAILANAAVMTIPFAFQHLFQKKLTRPWLIVFLQAAVWISYEFLHHHWDLAWPWLALGNAWANVPSLVQYISATGYLGISFWILITAGFVYQAVQSSKNLASYAAIVMGLLFPVISLIQYQATEISSGKEVEAVVVQPNFDTYRRFGGYGTLARSQQVLIGLSDSARTDSTDLIVWPESGIRTPLGSKLMGAVDGRVKEQMYRSADTWNATVIAGVVYYDYFPQGAVPPLARQSSEGSYLYYNAALGFYPDSTFDVYRKHNLVPMVERVPFVHFLDTIDLFNWIDWAEIQIYGKGYAPDQFDVNGTATPALVCYDSVFPSWVRAFVNNGAGFITIITNDGWWGDTSGHHQHFAFARLRAIEFRRWIVRSANNGISGIIDPYGGIKVKTDYWKRTAFRYQVPVLQEKTLYARWGDWLPVLMLVAAGGGIAFLVAARFRKPKQNQHTHS